MKEMTTGRRTRLPLQKIDEKTNELIDIYRNYLMSINIRVDRERAWEMLQKAHRLPYEYLIYLNEEDGIEYQGQGAHITHKHGDQLLVVKELGRFELKAVSSRKDQTKQATIRYKIPNDLLNEVRERVKVKDEEN